MQDARKDENLLLIESYNRENPRQKGFLFHLRFQIQMLSPANDQYRVLMIYRFDPEKLRY